MKMILEAILPHFILRALYPEKNFTVSGKIPRNYGTWNGFGKRNT